MTQIKNNPRKKLIVALRNFVMEHYLTKLEEDKGYTLEINFSFCPKNNSIIEYNITLIETEIKIEHGQPFSNYRTINPKIMDKLQKEKTLKN